MKKFKAMLVTENNGEIDLSKQEIPFEDLPDGDVLIREPDGWILLEAKSSTKLKPEHLPDISIQSYVVRQSLNKLGKKLKMGPF